MPNAELNIVDLRTDGRRHPLGLDRVPEFSVKVDSNVPDVVLESMQVVLQDRTGREVWDSGRVVLEGPPAIRYAGPALEPRASYSWQSKVWDADGTDAPWSAPADFTTGLMGRDLDHARWIRLDEETEIGETAPVQYLRREFTLKRPVVRALAFSTALGWYQLGINGGDVLGRGLFPGFTAFESRVEYQATDVTSLLADGLNVISLLLADGRFRGRTGTFGNPANYGNRTAVIAELEIELEGGEVLRIGTDSTWEGGHGAIVRSDPRAGETVDARLFSDWDRPGGSFADVRPVIEVDEKRSLVGAGPAAFIAGEELEEVSRTRAPSGATVVDLGQNFHGVARIRLRGRAGTEVVVNHSEVLTKDGEVDVAYLFGGAPIDTHIRPNRFILSGGDDVFEPRFSSQGFRYVAIDAPEGVEICSVQGVPMLADLDYHGSFSSSNQRVNDFHHNVVWSMRGNFLDVPTDCPTRERSGWTGDAQVFAPTALLLADAANYLANWLVDVRLQQKPDGTILNIVPRDSDPGAIPEILTGGEPLPDSEGSAGWGDAIVLIPWAIYQATGSTSALDENYDAMKRWIERYLALAAAGPDQDPYFVDSGFHWGEWLEPDGEGDAAPSLTELVADLVRRPRSWVATAYFEHSSRVLADIALLLERPSDASHFQDYADRARAAWQSHFMQDEKFLTPDAQASYVRALEFDLLPEERRSAAAARLVERIRERGTHIGTGFLSTGSLLDQLSQSGHDDVALDLLLQDEAPSWLAQVEAGATTIWETWEGHDDEGNPILSHNHYSLGASARWLYERLAGIRRAAPGWRTIRIDPLLNRRIPQVDATTATPFGPVAVTWALYEETATMSFDIPVGAEAEIALRGASSSSIAWDGETMPAEERHSTDGTTVVIRVGSGRHQVSWTPDAAAIVS